MLSILNIILSIITPIFIIVGLAVLLGHTFSLDPRILSRIVFYLFSPALAFKSMVQSDIQVGEIGQILAAVLLLYLVMGLISLGLSRFFHFDRKLESAFMLTVVVINAGNYGLPLCEFAFGAAGLQRAIIFFVVTALLSNTLGVFLASRGGASSGRSLLNILVVPMPYATILGLILNFGHIPLPLTIERALTLLGAAAVPCMLVVLGLQLASTPLKGQMGPVFLATAARLMIAPLVAFPLVALLGITGVARQVVIVQASLPTAVVSSVLAAEFGSDVDFAAAVILVSTLASVVTITILLALLM